MEKDITDSSLSSFFLEETKVKMSQCELVAGLGLVVGPTSSLPFLLKVASKKAPFQRFNKMLK